MTVRDTTSESPERRKERFLRLLEPVHDNLARFARSMTSGDEEARDLFGETVLRALEKLDGLKDERAFLGWLFTIAVRLHRRGVRRAELFGTYDEMEIAGRPSSNPSPETAHDVSALRSALDRLGARERETVVLFEIAGLSLEEVQGVQGGSLSGVKSRLVRGRRKLAKLLGEDDTRKKEPADLPATRKETGHVPDNRSEPFIYAAARSND